MAYRKKSGISNTVAAFFLIAITVIAAVICYAAMSGFININSSTCQVSIDDNVLYANSRGESAFFTATLKNTGSRPIVSISIHFKNEEEKSYDLHTKPLQPGKTYGVIFALANKYIIGNSYTYTVKAVADDNSLFNKVFSVICKLTYSSNTPGSGGSGGSGGGTGDSGDTGNEPKLFTIAFNVGTEDSWEKQSGQRYIVRASDGTLYAVYRENDLPRIAVRQSMDDGLTWSSPAIISGTVEVYELSVAITSNDVVHVVFSGADSAGGYDNYEIWHVRSVGSSWSNVELVSESRVNYFNRAPTITVTSDDRVHLVWFSHDRLLYSVYDGGWTVPISILSLYDVGDVYLTATANNKLCLVFDGTINLGDGWAAWCMFYNGGSWSSQTKLVDNGGESAIAVYNGVVHIAVTEHPNEGLWHCVYDGSWRKQKILSGAGEPALAFDEKGVLHLLWYDDYEYSIYYMRYYEKWSTPQLLFESSDKMEYYETSVRWSLYPSSNHVTDRLDMLVDAYDLINERSLVFYARYMLDDSIEELKSKYWVLGGQDGQVLLTNGVDFVAGKLSDFDITAAGIGSLLIGTTKEPVSDVRYEYDYPPRYIYTYYAPEPGVRLVRIGDVITDLSAAADVNKHVCWSYSRANYRAIASSGTQTLIGGYFRGIEGGRTYGFLLGLQNNQIVDYTADSIGKVAVSSPELVFTANFASGSTNEWSSAYYWPEYNPYYIEYLPVNSYTPSWTIFEGDGNPPWLDESSSNISPKYTPGSGSKYTLQAGNFGFADSNPPVSVSYIVRTVLEIRADVSLFDYFNKYPVYVSVWNGVSWVDIQNPMVFDYYTRVCSVDVTGILHTQEKVNGACIRLSGGYSDIFDIIWARLVVTWMKNEQVPEPPLSIKPEAAYSNSDCYGAHLNGTKGIASLSKVNIPYCDVVKVVGHVKLLSSTFNGGHQPSDTSILYYNDFCLFATEYDDGWFIECSFKTSYGECEYDIGNICTRTRLMKITFDEWMRVEVEIANHGAGWVKLKINDQLVLNEREVCRDRLFQPQTFIVESRFGWDMYADNFYIENLGRDEANWGSAVNTIEWFQDGYWLVAAESGLYKFSPGAYFTKISDECFYCSASGNSIAMFGGINGLWRFDGSSLQKIDNGVVSSIDFGEGVFLYAVDGVLKKYDNGVVTVIGSFSQSARLVSYSDGRWLIVSWSDGTWCNLAIYENNELYELSIRVPFDVFTVLALPNKEVLPIYPVTFNVVGAPENIEKSIILLGKTYTFTGNTFTLEVFAGSYEWQVPIVYASNNVRYAASAGSGILNVHGPTTQTITYSKQYLVSISCSPSEGGVVQPGATVWANAGSILEITASPASYYQFREWVGSGQGSYSGVSNPATITVNSPITEIAYFDKAVCDVTFSVNGLASDASSAVLMVDGASYLYSQLPKTFTWQNNSIHNFEWNSIVSASASKRYIWTSTSGLSTLQSGSLISKEGSVTAYYATQYLVTVNSAPHCTLSFTGTQWVTNGNSFTIEAFPDEGYEVNGFIVNGIYMIGNPLQLQVDKAYIITPYVTCQNAGSLPGWGYRKGFVVGAAAGAGSGYQIKLTVYYGSGVDSGSQVYLNGKCRSDFGDVRFTDDDGVSLLSCWLQEKVDGNYAVFWVKVNDDISSVSALLYIYYGNPSASSISDGDSTFLFFDSFDGSSLDLNKWAVYGTGCSYSVSGSILTLSHSGGYKWLRVQSKQSFGVNYAFAIRYQQTNINNYNRPRRIMWMTAATSENPAKYMQNYHNDYDKRLWQAYNTALESYNKGTDNTNWHITSIARASSSTALCFQDNTLENTFTSQAWGDDALVGIQIGSTSWNCYSFQVKVDWVLVRKYVNPEPSITNWSAEEAF
ncbi:MAG: DUF2341 domain-containing protein [Candidatus Bathyarchaeota archaeon]|nr:DUF2341 domain-containing protein [Candidatus Bathyarchaeota archaeon]